MPNDASGSRQTEMRMMKTSLGFSLPLMLICVGVPFAISSEGKIAFTSARAWGAGGAMTELFTMNADGSDIRQITGPAGPLAVTGQKADPTWSPDGTRVAFSQQGGGALDGDIYVVTLGAGDPVNLTHHPGSDREPAWSPNGELIAFGSGRDGRSDIWVMAPDGSSTRNLTDDREYDSSPVWSPNGRQIVFLREGGNLHVMDADGANIQQLMRADMPAADPTWSPDGTRVAFTEWATGSIYVVDADGTDLTRLTDGNWEWELDWYIPPSARAVSAVGKRPFAWGWLKGGARRSVAE
jgi:Tol biopolymer transport system component